MTKKEVFLWVENLTDKEMRFDCMWRLQLQDAVFDCAFIQLNKDVNALTRVEKWHSSKLFDTYRDEEHKMKK